MAQFYCKELERNVEVTFPQDHESVFDCESALECGRRAELGGAVTVGQVPMETCPAYQEAKKRLGIP